MPRIIRYDSINAIRNKACPMFGIITRPCINCNTLRMCLSDEFFGYEKEHYELSMKVGEDRLFPAVRRKDNDTEIVACGFSCRHQISDATGVKAKHWVEVLRGSN